MTSVNESIQPVSIFPTSEAMLASPCSETVAENDHKWRDRILGGALLVAAGAALIFEQSPANEALRLSVGLDVLKSTQNELAVGGVVAAITYGIEMGSSGLIAAGLNSRLKSLRRFSTFVHERLFKKSTQTESKTGDKITDMGIALGIGAGLVAAKHHVQNKQPSLKKDLAVANKASLIVAGVSGTIGVLAAGGIEHAENVGLGTPAEYVVKYGTDWKFWLGVVAAIQGGTWVKNKVMNRGSQKEVNAHPINYDEQNNIDDDETQTALMGEQA